MQNKLSGAIVTLIREIIKIRPEERKDWQTYIKIFQTALIVGFLFYQGYIDDKNEVVNKTVPVLETVGDNLSDGGAE